MDGPEASNLLSRHLRAVNSLLEGWWKDCQASVCVFASSYARWHTRCPYQEEASISPLLKLGHDAVDNVRLGGQDVYGVNVSLRRPPLLEALDVWTGQDGRLVWH
jgi:hypothetical protein